MASEPGALFARETFARLFQYFFTGAPKTARLIRAELAGGFMRGAHKAASHLRRAPNTVRASRAENSACLLLHCSLPLRGTVATVQTALYTGTKLRKNIL